DPVTPAAVEEFATDAGALIARVTDRREIETDTDVDVSFADPEDAVRERLDEMSLSSTALDVEEAVRSDTVPDSNVRETVKRRVEERLDDLDGFDPTARDAESEAPAADGDDSDASDEVGTDGQVSMEDYL
ncbi:DNA double-strand break repair protein Mre11, partial [Halorubrum pallidum]